MDNDLISRAAAKKIVSLMICAPTIKIAAEHKIDGLPAVNAAPVVLCKDCKYAIYDGATAMQTNSDMYGCFLWNRVVYDEFFCAAGEERKE